ncbi:MAG: hypothetical protein AAF092_09090 [Pseudomonadota bacterium]
MSNTDSFIEEVNEEVRRDRMIGLLRRYGWIAVLVIVVLVGGTAWWEYRKAQVEAAAEARGDAISEALRGPSPDVRAETILAIEPGGVVESFLAAAEFQAAGDTDMASQTLNDLAATPDLPALYRDLAQIKRLSIDTNIAPSERALILDRLAAPGAPYRTIATELQALERVAAGETEAAVAQLQGLLQDADASPVQRARVAQLIVALGETPELANSLLGATQPIPAQ